MTGTDQSSSHESRIRKAWLATYMPNIDEIIFAPTAPHAMRYLRDSCVHIDVLRKVTIVRHQEADVYFPKRQAVIDYLSPKAAQYLLSAFGGTDPLKAGSTNYHATHADDSQMKELVDQGLMRAHSDIKNSDDLTTFLLTEAGRDAAASIVRLYPQSLDPYNDFDPNTLRTPAGSRQIDASRRYVIINDADAPSPSMVCQFVPHIGYCYMKRDKGFATYDGMNGARATPIEEFGFSDSVSSDGIVSFKRVGPSYALYDDGKPRNWQHDADSFDLPFLYIGANARKPQNSTDQDRPLEAPGL